MRKRTVFEPCDYHAPMYASETRYRRAEVMVEGGWAGSPCPGEPCRMKPGTDFYCAEFVTEHPVYEQPGHDDEGEDSTPGLLDPEGSGYVREPPWDHPETD